MSQVRFGLANLLPAPKIPALDESWIFAKGVRCFETLRVMLRPEACQLVAEGRNSAVSRDASTREKNDPLGPAQSLSSSLQIAHWTHLSPAAGTPLQ